MNVEKHPVDEIDQAEFDVPAAYAAQRLRIDGYAFVDLQPGDGTTYRIVIVDPAEDRKNYWVGTSFGPLYPWAGRSVHWDYSQAKWVHDKDRSGEWTARVIARFLTAVAAQLTKEE